MNRKSELDYFHFVVFWILESRKQVDRKASVKMCNTAITVQSDVIVALTY